MTECRDDLLAWAARLRLVVGPLERHLRRGTVDRVSPTQMAVIGTVARHGPISLGDLATREGLSPSTISKVVAALEDGGLITRQFDPTDRRVCRVVLTDDGDSFVLELRERRNQWLALRLEALSTDELDTLVAAIAVLERLLDEE